MSHDFKVIHRKGANNVVPDALSRAFEKEESTNVATIKIIDKKTEKTTDEWYKKRIYQIKTHPRRYKDWKLIEKKIYRYKPDDEIDDIIEDLDAWKLVILQEKREQIINEMHDEPNAGHPGVDETYKKIAKFYYWPGIYKEVAEYVKNCRRCQECEIEQKGQIGLIGTRHIEQPWKAVSTDLRIPYNPES